MIYVGIDWAEAHHEVCVLDQAGTVLAKGNVSDDLEGVARLHQMAADHAEAPDEVVVGIETDRGLLVNALVTTGYKVYAINPMAASRYGSAMPSREPSRIPQMRRCSPIWCARTARTTARSPGIASWQRP